MNTEDILMLVKAGYTKDEIAQMQNGVQLNTQPVAVDPSVPDTEPQPAQIEQPAAVAPVVQQPAAQPVQQPAQVTQNEPAQPTMQDIMQGIAKLTSAVQANAIAQSFIPGSVHNQPTAEDMLAEIIRPTVKER